MPKKGKGKNKGRNSRVWKQDQRTGKDVQEAGSSKKLTDETPEHREEDEPSRAEVHLSETDPSAGGTESHLKTAETAEGISQENLSVLASKQQRRKPKHGAEEEQCSESGDKPEIQSGKESITKASTFLVCKFKEAKFTPSPGPGTAGHKIDLIVNYYRLHCNLARIYHYDVEVTECRDKSRNPQDNSEITKLKCQEIFTQFVEEMRQNKEFSKFDPVYDGNRNFYTAIPIPKSEKFSISLPIKADGKTKKFSVTVKPVKKADGTNIIDMQVLQNWNSYSTDLMSESLQALNTIMSYRDIRSGEVRIGRSFFSFNRDQTVTSLGDGLEIWSGYNQSVHFTAKGPAVIVNLSSKVFHKKLPVIEYVNEVLDRDIRENDKPLSASEISKIMKALNNVRVQVNHLNYKRKYYIKGVSDLPASKFHISVNDQEMSVADYFQQKYTLQYPHLHCLQMRTNNNKTFIPFEKCEILEGQPKSLGDDYASAQVTSKVINYTAVQPKERFANIQQRVKSIENEHMKKFKLFLELNPMKIQGRVIRPPLIKYEGGKASPINGKWGINGKFPKSLNNESWTILYISDERRCTDEALQKFKDQLESATRNFGLVLGDFKGIHKCFRSDVSSEEALQKEEIKSASLIIIVISKKDKYHNYDEIKFIADFKLQLVTQCVMEELVSHLTHSSLINLCLKINVKLGGANHVFEQSPRIFTKPVIIFGADVVHSTMCPSIAAVVGSLDAYPSKYQVSCRVQENEKRGKKSQELILELKGMVVTILEAFKENTRGKIPEKIIFFRDGVSEGQFVAVRDHEVASIRDASLQVAGHFIPLTFVIVQKRHQTRIRPENAKDGVGRAENVPPGTTIDTDITYPNTFDYFLCSHEGIRGTSKPARYTVLHDDNKFSADELQQLSYHMCHMYARCTKSVSIPAPVKYADLAAYRAKKYADYQLKKMKKEGGSSYSGLSSQLPTHARTAINKMEESKNHMFYV